MKLRSQLILSMIAFGVVLIIISASVIITNKQVAQVSNNEQTANNINTGASNLAYIANDYFLYRQNAQINSWQSQFSSLQEETSILTSSNPEQVAQIQTVTGDLQRLGTVFNSSVSILQSIPENESALAFPAFQTSSSRLNVQNQALAFDASVLSNSFENQSNQLNQTNNILIFALLGAFGAYFVMIYLVVFRRTFRSITKLQDGTKIVGSGNLDYSVGSDSNDEIGELSRSFNQMMSNLKTVTASKTDLEQAQASLRESEQRWSTTLASIGDAVIATDLSGQIVFMNGVAEKLTGWTLTEASLKSVKDVFNIVNEQTLLEVEDPVSKVLVQGTIVGLANHTLLIQKNKTEVAIDDSGAPIKDKEGKTTGVVLIFRDITERRKAEEAIQTALDRFYSSLSRMYGAILLVSAQGTVEFANQAFCDYFLLKESPSELKGLSSEAIIEKIKNAYLHPDEEVSRVKEIVTAGKPVVGEEVALKGNRTSLRDFIPLNEKGSSFSRLWHHIDISERKKAEEALKENEQLYRTVFDNSQDGFQLIELVYDNNGEPIDHKFLKVNHAYEKIIGVKAEDILDKTAKYISPNQELHWLEVPDRVAKTGISEHVELYNKDINKTLDCYYFLYSKNVIGTLFRDITERKRLEKQLQDQERLAAIGATAGMVGHDIRNPLQAITGDLFLAKTELETLPENEQKTSALESLDEIEHNIDYINKIVADLQDYARPLNPRAQETNIKSLFNEILAKNGIPKDIKITVEVEDKAERIMADPDYLKRIVTNLTLNAVQAMPDGGKLTIRAYSDKHANDVLITVKDTGVGIPEDIKPKLFTPMMTTKSKGQGFGLAVVKRMTEGLGGTVTFESIKGKGTTFTVRLPQRPFAK